MRMRTKTGIRMKIFLPVLLVLILFPLASFLVFRATSSQYLEAVARRDLDELVMGANEIVSAVQNENIYQPQMTWAEQVKEILKEVKARLRTGGGQADMLIYNSNFKLVYPKAEDTPELTGALDDYCRRLLEQDIWEQTVGRDGSVRLGERTYLTQLVEIPGDGKLRAKYMIAYVPVQDHTALLVATGYLVLFITAGVAVLSVIAVWVIAGNMQKPLKILCRHTEEIEQNHFNPVEQEFSVRELEELRAAINRMEQRLEGASQAQHVFFQNVSHDLRTPLMSICGYAQGIEQGIFPDEKKAAGIIAGESIRLKKLVDGILTLSKLDDGSFHSNICSICLNDYIEETLEKLKGMEQMGRATVLFANPEREITVRADAELLDGAMRNILSNGIRYAKSRVMITLVQDGEMAVIRIADDGDGIAGEDIPHVFERFYKGKNGNFGIGLSIAATAMEHMGGSITVDNGERGALFCLYLPVDVPGRAGQSLPE